MEIKGNIGEEVYVKANIRSIHVDECGAVYHVHIADGNEFEIANVEEKNIKFSENLMKNPLKSKDTQKKETEVPAPSEVVKAAKRRGRPRKTTVDDLVMKCAEL